eukprot:PDM60957.1 mdt-22 [Pristionchus pacificus]
MQAAKPAGVGKSNQSSKGNASKVLVIQEYKRRLRDNIRSLNENFVQLITAAKIKQEDEVHKCPNGRMAEHATTRYEMKVRAALIVKACDELSKLTNDLKEFLILHDFNFLTEAISKAENECDDKLRHQLKKHNDLRIDIAKIVFDMSHQLRNPWADYVRYREEKTKKIRLPTRPKMEMPQLGVWLRGLSTEMRDLGHERQASCIHEEIAELYLSGKHPTAADRNEARKEYLMAARLSARGEDARRDQNYLTPLTSASCEDLFNKAIHLSMQMNDLKMAGLTAFEAATATREWKHNGETTIAFLERAIRLLEGEGISQSTAYFHLILAQAERDKWSICLSLLDDLWMILMKSKQDSILVETSLVECEIMTALIVCMMSPPEVAGRHKCIHDMYSKLHPVEVHFSLLEEGKNEAAEEYRQQVQSRSKRNHQWSDIPEESCLGDDRFWLLKDIIWMIYYGETENLTTTLEDKEEMETFPEYSRKLIPLVAARATSEEDWQLPYDPARELLQPREEEEEEDGGVEEMNGSEEKKEAEKNVEEKLDAHDMERSWRMGRFIEDTGLEEEGGRDDGLPEVNEAESTVEEVNRRARRRTMRESIERGNDEEEKEVDVTVKVKEDVGLEEEKMEIEEKKDEEKKEKEKEKEEIEEKREEKEEEKIKDPLGAMRELLI